MNKLFKSASTVSAFTLLSRITGFVRESIIAASFGASAVTDAFNVAFRIPNLFRRLFAEGAFSQAFVPVLSSTLQQQGEAKTQELIDQITVALGIALLLLSILGVVFAPALVWLMASGIKSQPHAFELASNLTRWMFPYIFFMSLVALAAGVLNTFKRFAVPAATPVLLNLCMIAAAYFAAPMLKKYQIEPIYALAAGVLIGGAAQLVVQFWALKRLGKLPRVQWNLAHWLNACRSDGTRQIITLMLPALLGVSVAQISLLINTQIASHLGTGSVSWLSYADRLMEFPVALLGIALGVVMTPQLAAAKASAQPERYSEMLDWGLRCIFLLGIPSMLALLVLAKPIISVVYQYGIFSSNDVSATANALTGYGAGLIGLLAVKVLAPAYFAAKDVGTPAKIAVLTLCVVQTLNLIFVPLFAHAGLALSIGLGAIFNASVLFFGLIRKKMFTPNAGWLRFSLQVFGASAILAGIFFLSAQKIDWTQLSYSPVIRATTLFSCLVIAACSYFFALHLFGFRIKAFLRK